MEERQYNNAVSPPGQEPQQEVPTKEVQQEAPTPKSGKVGPLVGIVIVVVLLIFGGLYLWGAQLNEQARFDENSLFDTSLNDDIASPSDEPAQIERDLDTFDTTDFEAQIEADLDALEAELDGI